jgi:molybdopterin-synthase adenylyltransferase
VSRYSRSEVFPGIGPEGQKRLGGARLAIVGVGAIGTVAAEIAVRAGFGHVTLFDRDVVDESNLQRQFLFEEEDARRGRPKAEAAAERLRACNSTVSIRAVVEDLAADNAVARLSGHDLLLDGSDNFETRFLVSDTGRKLAVPSIYAACVGSEGIVAVTRAQEGAPCLRCYLGALPRAGSGPTCDTAGVVPALPPLVASLAMAEALRLGVGQPPSRGVLTLTVWEGDIRPVRAFARARPSPECPVCAGNRYPALEGAESPEAVALCGRASVQVKPPRRERPDFDLLERALSRLGPVQRGENVLSAEVEDVTLTVFSDGRCVVRGTADLDRARRLCLKYVGRG